MCREPRTMTCGGTPTRPPDKRYGLRHSGHQLPVVQRRSNLVHRQAPAVPSPVPLAEPGSRGPIRRIHPMPSGAATWVVRFRNSALAREPARGKRRAAWARHSRARLATAMRGFTMSNSGRQMVELEYRTEYLLGQISYGLTRRSRWRLEGRDGGDQAPLCAGEVPLRANSETPRSEWPRSASGYLSLSLGPWPGS